MVVLILHTSSPIRDPQDSVSTFTSLLPQLRVRPEGRSSGIGSIRIAQATREDAPSDDLLKRDSSLPTTSTEKRERPVGERRQITSGRP
jgi:hypothetical protein